MFQGTQLRARSPFYLVAMEIVEIEIVNWIKHNEKHDTARQNSWFKVYNHMNDDPKIVALKDSEYRVWNNLLSERSIKKETKVIINVRVFILKMRMKPKKFMQALETLNDSGLITYDIKIRIEENKNKKGKKPNTKSASSLEEPKQKPKASTPAKLSFETEIVALYKSDYPRKEGKTRGVQILAKQITSLADLSSLEIAVKHYAKSVTDREVKFIKQFSAFANCWRDYIEPLSNGKPEIQINESVEPW